MKGYGLFMLVALLLSGCSTSKDEMLPGERLEAL